MKELLFTVKGYIRSEPKKGYYVQISITNEFPRDQFKKTVEKTRTIIPHSITVFNHNFCFILLPDE